MPSPPMTAARRKLIVDCYRVCGNVREAAKLAQASTRTVRTLARAAGILAPNHRRRAELPPVQELRRLRERHGSCAAVAAIVGCCRDTVRSRLAADRMRGGA